MGKQLVNSIRGMNPLARKGALLLLTLLISFACLSAPRSSEAAVAVQMNWRNTAAATTVNSTSATAGNYFRSTTALPGATNPFPIYLVGSGTNRLLVVSLSVNTSAPSNTLRPVVTYGGRPLAIATSDQATSSRQHTWLFYLQEADIQAAVGTNLSFTYGGTDTGLVRTGVYANAAVYNGVDQTTPYQYQTTFNSGATASVTEGPVVPSQIVVTGDYALEINDSLRTGVATAPTVTLQTGWTSRGSGTRTGTAPAAYAMRCQMAYRNTVGTWTSQHTASVAVLNSISAMTLKQALIPGVANGTAVPNLDVYASDTNKVVDAFSATGGLTLTSVTITGNANTTPANISKVTIYKKMDANLTVYSPGVDTIVGTPVTNPTFPLNYTMNEIIVAGTNYIITYDIAPGATGNGTSITLTGRITAINPVGGTNTDTAGATLTILVTTSLNDATEPAATRVKNASAPVLLNAFSVRHTGVSPTDDDTVTSVSVTLAPQFISGGSAATLSKIKTVEIVDATNTIVYGSVNAATLGDTWNIPLNPVFTITPTATTYYVRIRTANSIIPSINDLSCVGAPATCTGYYGVTGTVTAFQHTKANNKVVITDAASQTVAIDFEDPANPTAFTALAPEVLDPNGTLNLTWTAASTPDPHSGSLDGVKPYKIVRGEANGGVPNPHCIDGTDISTAGGTINYGAGTATDVGLISTQATQYKYRICAIDSLGNSSHGVTTFGFAKVNSVCNVPPIVKLMPESQIIKTVGTTYALQVANMDTGVCPDVTFSLALVNEGGSNPADFTKSMPASVTLGTGGAGHASTGANAIITIGAIPTAVQLGSYQFAVQVSSPGNNHGLPLTTATVSGLLNDMPPIVHNSANMNKFAYGGWGQTYTCATCHSNSTTNIKGVYQLISTPIGKRNVVFTKTSSGANDYLGVYSNDKRTAVSSPNNRVSNQICSVCHHRTRQHQYSSVKSVMGNIVGPGGNEPYDTNHMNSRDCVACHTHNSAFRSITGTCGDCHGTALTSYAPVDQATMVKNVSNALGPNPPNYGAHAAHTRAQVGCSACHSNSNHGALTAGWLGDNKMEMGFTISNSTFTGFNSTPVVGGEFFGTSNLNFPMVWTTAPGTTLTTINQYTNSCVTYCHGNWTGNAGNGSQQQPIWVGGPVEVVCGSCHYATGTTPPPAGSHNKHSSTNGAGNGIACIKCHATYTTYTGAAHINGKVQWNLSAFPQNGGATYKGAPSGETTTVAGGGTYGSCSNLYCHSNVRSGADGSGPPTSYATPTWGGSATCGSCHAEPNQSGSHARHENGEVSFDCHVCHSNGGTTAPTKHADGNVDLVFIGLGQGTAYTKGTSVPAGTAYGSCTSNCHGRFDKTWGSPSAGLSLCNTCHGSDNSPGGFYGTKGPGSSVFANESGVGVHDIHIQNLNSPRKTAFARFTSFAAPFNCNQCHYNPTGPFSAGHVDTALPAEAAFSSSSSIAHNGDVFGYYSTPTYSAATLTCSNIWCHGAGMNSNRSAGPYVGTTRPARTNPKWNVPFLTGATNGFNTPDCNKCHALPPPAPNATFIHFGKTLATCDNCHSHITDDGLGFDNKKNHVNGTVEATCGGCHGNPPINSTVGTIDGLATPPQNALLPGNAGAHGAHILLPAIGTSCTTCHTGASGLMPSNQLEIGFGGLGGQVTTGVLTGYSAAGVHPNWKSTSAGTQVNVSAVQDVTCANLYCHGGGSTNPVRAILGGGPLAGNPRVANWGDPIGSIVCGDCHGVDNANAPTGGSHPRHALTVASLGCQSCHGEVNDNGTHVDAKVNWKLDRANPVIGANATYFNISSGSIAGLAPHTTYQSCNNIYCHSTVQSSTGVDFAGVTFSSPQWGSGPVACGSCHKNMATDPAPTGSHLKHANPTLGMNVPCGYCHQDAGAGFATLHADGKVFVNFTSYVGGTYSVGTADSGGMQKTVGSGAFGTCSTTFCHGTNASPQWGVAGTTCSSCHGASKTQAASWSGRHVTHFNNMTAPTLYTDTVRDLSTTSKYVFNCAHCHDDNVAKHSLKPASAMSSARVFFGISTANPPASSKRGTYVAGATPSATDNGFKSTNGTCNTSYCHSNGRGGAPKNLALTWTTIPTGGSNCLYCHDGKRTSMTPTTLSSGNGVGRHDKHMNYSTNQILGKGNGLNCIDCHARVVTDPSNLTIFNKGKHVNAMVDYSSTHGGGSSQYVYSTKSCTTFCHSNGNQGAVIFVSMTGSKAWNGNASFVCSGCHGRTTTTGSPDYAPGAAGTPTANLHTGHMSGLTDTTGCSACHRRTASSTIANRFVDYSAGTTHLNGGTNVYFDKAKAFIGTKATVTQAATVTCSTVVCHGQATTPALAWGAPSTAHQCQKCHGSKATAFATFSSPQVAPGYGADGTDTSMTKKLPTDPRVGAHQRHLVSNVITTVVKCGECHVSVTNIRSGNHWNYSTATITFNGRAKSASHNPTVSRTGGLMQCSNTYCHTGKSNSAPVVTTMAPFWNMTGIVKEGTLTVASCNKCHGFPPKLVGSGGTTLGYDHTSITDPTAFPVTVCTSCHANLSSTGTNYTNIFAIKSQHMNGTIEATGHSANFPGATHASYAGATTPAASCSGCHTTWNAVGPYPAAVAGDPPSCRGCHITGILRTVATSSCYDCHGSGATQATAYPNGNVFPNISGSHTKHVVGQSMACSACHDGKGGNIGDLTHGSSNRIAHTNNTFVNVTSTTAQFKFTWAGGTGKGTCSTNTCHATAEWGVTKIGCNGCHDYDTNGGTWGLVNNRNYGGTATAEGRGAHYKHIEYLKSAVRTGSVTTLNPNTDTYGNSAFNAVCGVCHSTSPTNHTAGNAAGTRSITFPAARNFGGTATYNGQYNTSSSVNPKSCSNIDCHYRTSPIWSTY